MKKFLTGRAGIVVLIVIAIMAMNVVTYAAASSRAVGVGSLSVTGVTLSDYAFSTGTVSKANTKLTATLTDISGVQTAYSLYFMVKLTSSKSENAMYATDVGYIGSSGIQTLTLEYTKYSSGETYFDRNYYLAAKLYGYPLYSGVTFSATVRP